MDEQTPSAPGAAPAPAAPSAAPAPTPEAATSVPNMMVPPAAPPEAPKGSSSVGQMIGAVIIVALVAIGGLYYWGMRLNQQMMDDQTESMMQPGEENGANPGASGTETNVSTDAAIRALETQGTSDETSSIEADLNATDVESLDGDMQGVDTSGN